MKIINKEKNILYFMKEKALLLIIIFMVLLTGREVFGGNSVQYISPLPDSKYNLETTNIIIGYTEKLSTDAVGDRKSVV